MLSSLCFLVQCAFSPQVEQHMLWRNSNFVVLMALNFFVSCKDPSNFRSPFLHPLPCGKGLSESLLSPIVADIDQLLAWFCSIPDSPCKDYHKMVGIGRDLCGSSSPTPLPKQGHLQQAAQDLVQAGLKYLQRGRLHSLPGQPVPVLSHPQREEVLPHVQMELPVLQFVPIAPCPVTGHH